MKFMSRLFQEKIAEDPSIELRDWATAAAWSADTLLDFPKLFATFRMWTSAYLSGILYFMFRILVQVSLIIRTGEPQRKPLNLRQL